MYILYIYMYQLSFSLSLNIFTYLLSLSLFSLFSLSLSLLSLSLFFFLSLSVFFLSFFSLSFFQFLILKSLTLKRSLILFAIKITVKTRPIFQFRKSKFQQYLAKKCDIFPRIDGKYQFSTALVHDQNYFCKVLYIIILPSRFLTKNFSATDTLSC